MRVGLIAMSAKPFHAGHMGLIRAASAKNDEVKVFVSLSDRARKGEPTISGPTMKTIWDQYLLPIMPDNVTVVFSPVPVRSVYETLGKANENGSEDTYTVYSDPSDLDKNFPEKNRTKYFGNLYAAGNAIFQPISRASTIDVSGTKMRQYLSSGDKENFIKNLPSEVDGDAVWSLLHDQIKTETTLRVLVRRLSVI